MYAVDQPGAFTRGASKDEAVGKMPAEIKSYIMWRGFIICDHIETEIIQEKESGLAICDADSDVLFDEERCELRMQEYLELKALALKSAHDFLTLYQSIPDKNKTCLPERKSFYGQVPRTASEMYEHTKNVNDYYFGEIDVSVDNQGDIAECRKLGFEALERQPDFLKSRVFIGSYDEEWTLRKILRRFVWHDSIHAKAMYRMAARTFGKGNVPDVFCFDCVPG